MTTFHPVQYCPRAQVVIKVRDTGLELNGIVREMFYLLSSNVPKNDKSAGDVMFVKIKLH